MAILEITLEKPALTEEIVHERKRASDEAESERDGGGTSWKLPLLGLAVALVGVALVRRRLRSDDSTEQSQIDEYDEVDVEASVDTETATDGGRRGGRAVRALGLATAVASAAFAVRKVRARSSE